MHPPSLDISGMSHVISLHQNPDTEAYSHLIPHLQPITASEWWSVESVEVSANNKLTTQAEEAQSAVEKMAKKHSQVHREESVKSGISMILK